MRPGHHAPRPSILCDVDGCVADLVGGMRRFTNERFGIDFEPSDVVFHDRMGRSPGLAGVHEALKHWFPESADAEYNGFGGAFRCFMKERDVYGEYIKPIEGAVDAIADLRVEFDIVFVTALMKSARDHFRSKMEWLERWFPDIPIITAPSGEKWRVRGDYGIDDRYDTCLRWEQHGTPARIFRQPWNEIPEGMEPYAKTYDWDTLRNTLRSTL